MKATIGEYDQEQLESVSLLTLLTMENTIIWLSLKFAQDIKITRKAFFKLMSKIEQRGCYLRPIVLYSSKSGNTEKIAREISSELNCRCEKISENFDSSLIDLDDYNLVFLGTGNYGAKPNAEMLNYLKEMNLNNNRIFALFMTWLGRGTTDKAVYDIIKAAVEEKGQRLIENYYSCLFQGPSTIARVIFRNANGHPTAEDLNNARKWAKEIVKSIGDF